jgi:hypothetical protein
MEKKKLEIGKCYFVRTVTFIFTGELVKEYDDCIVLKKAAWIADTGRFANAMKSFDFSEVEPYPENMEVNVYKGALIDVSLIPLDKLPRKQK